LVNHVDQAIVEVKLRVSDVFVGLLEQRIQAGVCSDGLVHIDGLDQQNKGRVAQSVVRIDALDIGMCIDHKAPLGGIDRP